MSKEFYRLQNRLEDYITQEVDPSGWIKAYALSPQQAARSIRTPYFTYLIATILDSLPGSKFKLLPRISNNLEQQASRYGTYNYWPRGSQRDKLRHLPDDWDDTALAYSLLVNHPEIAVSKNFPLLKAARSGGGLFQTWILPEYPSPWISLDPWVNLNCLYWLAQEEIFLVDQWKCLLQLLQSNNTVSAFYPDKFSAVYFLSRALALPNCLNELDKREAGLFIQAKRTLDHMIANLLTDSHSKSLSWIQKGWLCAAILLQRPQDPVAGEINQSFLAYFAALNFVPLEPVIYGWRTRGRMVYDSAPALTAALFLQASHLFQAKINDSSPITPSLSSLTLSTEAKTVLGEICPSPFVQEVLSLTQEVTLQLKVKPDSTFQQSQSLANWLGSGYFWLDDCYLDGHLVCPRENRLKEELYEQYYRLQQELIPTHHPFWMDWERYQQEYQKASQFEAEQLRFSPDRPYIPVKPVEWKRFLEMKFGPYLAAILAVLAFYLPERECREKKDELLAPYRHYLLAKQLSDDARDILADLRAGRLTAGTCLINSVLSGKTVSALCDKEIEGFFLRSASASLGRKILTEIELARRYRPAPALEKRLDAIGQGVYRAIRRRGELQLLLSQTTCVSK